MNQIHTPRWDGPETLNYQPESTTTCWTNRTLPAWSSSQSITPTDGSEFELFSRTMAKCLLVRKTPLLSPSRRYELTSLIIYLLAGGHGLWLITPPRPECIPNIPELDADGHQVYFGRWMGGWGYVENMDGGYGSWEGRREFYVLFSNGLFPYWRLISHSVKPTIQNVTV
jgi:hypothetical protein